MLKRRKRKAELKFITSKNIKDRNDYNEYNKTCNEEKTVYLSSKVMAFNGDQKKLYSY